MSKDEIVALIDKNLDVMIEHAEYFSYESDLIDAHPDEFAEIVALGENALPYLDEIIKNSENFSPRKSIAMYAQYATKPELYDLVFPSPDGKYLVKATVYSFMGVGSVGNLYNVYLLDRLTDSVIFDLNDIVIGVKIEWSPDSRYFAISHHVSWVSATNVFDTQTGNYINLPQLNELKEVIKETLSNFYCDREYFDFEKWISDDTIKIKVFLRIYDVDQPRIFDFDGWYIYDLTEEKIADMDYSIEQLGEE
ncbi:MAG: hypothetical protein FWF92_07325 [Oscillospiraceae bacterium]|nr:hypothetical protein [Oscillospiraceae bacterium]